MSTKDTGLLSEVISEDEEVEEVVMERHVINMAIHYRRPMPLDPLHGSTPSTQDSHKILEVEVAEDILQWLMVEVDL